MRLSRRAKPPPRNGPTGHPVSFVMEAPGFPRKALRILRVGHLAPISPWVSSVLTFRSSQVLSTVHDECRVHTTYITSRCSKFR